jgi:hypothetical protein
MECPVCALPLLYPAATACPRCGYALGESGPINLPADTGGRRPSLHKAAIPVLFALCLLGVYAYFSR